MSVFQGLDARLQSAIAELGIGEPSEAQRLVIPELLARRNVLVVAPTGIGKTEAAMLPILDSVLREQPDGFNVLYITPLRALNRDMLRRLEWFGQRLGITVGVRHGDTGQYERSKQSRNPPQILITTPETFQIMFTGKNLIRHLANVRWVVVDEIHELAQDERGAQLAVGLERLADMGAAFVRVGLSATVGSPEMMADFLRGGGGPVRVINVVQEKDMHFSVSYPRPVKGDETLADTLRTDTESAARLRHCRRLIEEHDSTLLFVNTRNTAEVLAARFHLAWEDFPVGVHHGSLSKAVRVQMEEEFKAGILRGLICTSSLELGIDIGSADFTVQYGSPRQASRMVQRAGRSGHSIGMVSRAEIVCDSPDDILESAVVARRSLDMDLEPTRIRECPLGVLANQLLACAMSQRDMDPGHFFNVVKRAYPFRNLDRATYDRVLEQLHELGVIWGADGRIERRRRTRGQFFDNVSMIPDERTYRVVDITERRPIGTLDESFVAAVAEPGLPFIVRGLPWRIVDVEDDTILVEPAREPGPVPSWTGEDIPVPLDVAREVGRLREAGNLGDYPLDRDATAEASAYLEEQRKAGLMPSDTRITVEVEGRTVIINACLGSRINETLSKVLAALLMARNQEGIMASSDAYHVMLHLPRPMDCQAVMDMLAGIEPDSVLPLLKLYLKHSTYLRWKFVQVAKKFGAIRKDADFRMLNMDKVMEAYGGTPLMEEALDKCIWDLMDPEGAARVLEGIRSGKFSVECSPPTPMGQAILEARTDLLLPRRPTHAILMAMKSRLERTDILMGCMNCRRKSRTSPGLVEERPMCPVCGSMMLAVLHRREGELLELLARQNLSQAEKRTVRRLMKNANLVKVYGRRAVLAMAARGVGPDAAARILAMNYEDEDDFLAALLEAEITFARTKRFW